MTEENDKPFVIVRQDEARLKDLARDNVTGRVFIANTEHAIKAAFYMMTALMPPVENPEDAGAFVGFMDQVVPGRSMNGYPIFTSMLVIHKDDLPLLMNYIEQMEKALEL